MPDNEAVWKELSDRYGGISPALYESTHNTVMVLGKVLADIRKVMIMCGVDPRA